tara:strand:- start:10733 stop:10999 length:267 start_codon:yes stop_codon:yes gene_type:complete
MVPKYSYWCKHCDKIYERVHSLSDEHHQCILCKQKGEQERVPSSFYLSHSKFYTTIQKPGELVKQTIKEAKEDLKISQADLKDRTYEN